MDEKRKLELLAYAKVCFEHGTTPFAMLHLNKKKVTADECKDLSNLIAEVIDGYSWETWQKEFYDAANKKAEKEFMETQP